MASNPDKTRSQLSETTLRTFLQNLSHRGPKKAKKETKRERNTVLALEGPRAEKTSKMAKFSEQQVGARDTKVVLPTNLSTEDPR